LKGVILGLNSNKDYQNISISLKEMVFMNVPQSDRLSQNLSLPLIWVALKVT
jgi:hypothetical protein